MRVGYEFYVDAPAASASELAAEFAAAAGTTAVRVEMGDGVPKYAFGVVHNEEVYPVVIRRNEVNVLGDPRSAFPFVASLEGDLALDGERALAAAQAIASNCLGGCPTLVTYDTEQVVGLRAADSAEPIELRAPVFVSDQLATSKAFSIAAARAAQAGYEL